MVPVEYQDDVCPIPPPDVVSKYKASKNSSYSTNNQNNDTTTETNKYKKMTVAQLKVELRKLNLSTSDLKKDLIDRLTNALQVNDATQEKQAEIPAPVLL